MGAAHNGSMKRWAGLVPGKWHPCQRHGQAASAPFRGCQIPRQDAAAFHHTANDTHFARIYGSLAHERTHEAARSTGSNCPYAAGTHMVSDIDGAALKKKKRDLHLACRLKFLACFVALRTCCSPVQRRVGKLRAVACIAFALQSSAAERHPRLGWLVRSCAILCALLLTWPARRHRAPATASRPPVVRCTLPGAAASCRSARAAPRGR